MHSTPTPSAGSVVSQAVGSTVQCLRTVLVSTAVLTACHAAGRVSPSVASPPSELLGRFVDDYDNAFELTAQRFDQLPNGRFHIVEWNPGERYFVARNDPANPQDGGRWTRVDWMSFTGMPPYRWGFCLTAYRAESQASARETAPPNRESPRTGCNGFPFSRMKPATGERRD